MPKRTAKPVVYPVTDQWRRDILERMDQLGVKQAELARRVGCKEPTLTMLFRTAAEGGAQKTKLMAAIHEVLKLPPPTVPSAAPPPSVDPLEAELRDVIGRLSPEWKEKLLDIAKNFPVKPKG